MAQPKAIPPQAEPPAIYGYTTWVDENGYHGRYTTSRVPRHLREVHAPTARELIHEAVRNKVKIWVWETA